MRKQKSMKKTLSSIMLRKSVSAPEDTEEEELYVPLRDRIAKIAVCRPWREGEQTARRSIGGRSAAMCDMCQHDMCQHAVFLTIGVDTGRVRQAGPG